MNASIFNTVRRRSGMGDKGRLSPGLRWCGFLMFFLLSTGARAQFTVVFDQSTTENVKVSYNTDSSEYAHIKNYFIKEIAKSIPRRFDFTSYDYSYRQVIRVIRLEDGTYEASVDINEARCSGDVFYKGFDISDVLFPNRISFKAVLFDKYKKEVAAFNYTGSDLHWGYNKIGFKTFSDTIRKPSFTFHVTENFISYDSLALLHFARKLKLIDRYYQSKAIIAAGNQKLDAFDFENIDKIIVYDIMLKDIERQVEDLYQLDLPGELSLSSFDPIGYIDLFTAFSERTRQIRQREENSLANLDKIYYERGRKLLAAGDTPRALLYLKRSCNYNPLFVPSWFERAKLLVEHDSIIAAADIIQLVLTDMNPDPAMSDSVHAFADQILKTLQLQGHDHLVLEKYNESLTLIERAIRFCEGTPGFSCSEQIYKDYAASKHGLYKSYLTVAEKALQGGRYDLARAYVREARDYQQKNPREIIGNAGADAVMLKLINQMVKRGDTLCGRKKYEQALDWYHKAAADCDSLAADLCPAGLEKGFTRAYNGLFSAQVQEAHRYLKSGELDRADQRLAEAKVFQEHHSEYVRYLIDYDTVYRAVRQARYDLHIQTGLLSLKYMNYEDAFNSFEQALTLSETIRLRENKQLDSLLRITGLPVLQTRIQYALSLIQPKGLDAARDALKRTETQISHCGLSADSLISLRLKSAVETIRRSHCDNVARTCTSYNDQAGRAEASGDYMLARQIYDTVVAVIAANPECETDSTPVIRARQRVLPPATYQTMMKSLPALLLVGDTNTYFVNYVQAGTYFNDQGVAAFGLRYTTLVDHLSENAAAALQLRAIEFFTRREAFQEALHLLKVYTGSTRPDPASLRLQLSLAVKWADADYSSNPLLDPLVRVVEYTESNPGLSPFRRQYLKTFKSLKKSSGLPD